MVLQDSSEVAFPENDSHKEDLLSNKELSSFKECSRFLGMLVQGCEEKIGLLPRKLRKKAGGGILVEGRRRNRCPLHISKGNLGDWIAQLAMENLCLRPEGAVGTIGN